jgi:hypothetical protein
MVGDQRISANGMRKSMGLSGKNASGSSETAVIGLEFKAASTSQVKVRNSSASRTRRPIVTLNASLTRETSHS